MTKQNTTTNVSDSRKTADEATSIFGWGWPDEARLAAFAEQNVLVASSDRAEMVHRMEPTGQPSENNFAYAALYFVA